MEEKTFMKNLPEILDKIINHKNILIIFFYCLLLLSPFLLEKQILRHNDLDEITFNLSYIKQSLLTYHTFPQWNPFANEGIPTVSDPLNAFYNPVVGIPFVILPFSAAIKTTYLLVAILSALSMYYVLKKLKVNNAISLISSLIYVSCGYLASRIVAGHFLLLTFPLLPVIFYSLFIITAKKNYFWSIVLSLMLTLSLFSGDLYNLLYSSILFGVAFLYIFARKRFSLVINFIVSGVVFILFSMVKLFPMLQLPGSLIKAQEPFAGSQNIISIIYYLFFPVKPVFAHLDLGGFLNTGFAWWEKISFIGPLPPLVLIFWYKFRKKIKNADNLLLIIFLIVVMLVSMPAPTVNPLHFLILKFTVLQDFHVPSRVFALLAALIIIIQSLVLNAVMIKKWKIKIIFLLAVNLVLTTAFFWFVLIVYNLPPMNVPDYQSALKEIRQKDPSIFYLAQSGSSRVPANIALKTKQKFIQNYAFTLANSPAFTYVPFWFTSNSYYRDITPKYFLTEGDKDLFVRYKPALIYSHGNVNVYKISSYTPYAQFSANGIKKEIKNVDIKINTISLNLDSTQSGTVTLLESYYPGWQIFVDGKKENLLNNRFLEFDVYKGQHSYLLTFSSKRFGYGLLISLISYIIFIILGIKYRSKIRQEISLK